MYRLILGLNLKWPFLHKLVENERVSYIKPNNRQQVRLPDGRIGVIDHIKLDGMIGVRPIDDHGNYFPNTTLHWSMEDRIRIPEELSLKEVEYIE